MGLIVTSAFPCVKIHPDAQLPTRDAGDLGWDFYCVGDDTFSVRYSDNKGPSKILLKGQSHVFKTGIRAAIPKGFGMLLRDRSGLAAKYNLHVLAGVIDSTYTKEWMICLKNLSIDPYCVYPGDRIAQGILIKNYPLEPEWVNEIPETERGEGFGSSGK